MVFYLPQPSDNKQYVMLIDDLSTPSLLIERFRLDTNLRRMQERADVHDVDIRPHTKTHKSIDLARMQVDLGATGITVAKVGEAEIYAAAGFDDIRIAYVVVGREKLGRIARLQGEGTRITFCVDTIEGAQGVSDYFGEIGKEAEVLVEVDVGYGRCGVRWNREESVSFVRAVMALNSIRVTGILTHAGQSYDGPGEGETKEEALRRVSAEERDRMLDFAVALGQAGLADSEQGVEISIGSTPSIKYFENRCVDGFRITEIRPGNYVFHDGVQVGLGVADWVECALTVHTSVISRHRNPDGSDRLFLDAGKKVFTSDRAFGLDGYGMILYNAKTMDPLPHATITGLSEEHGWVRIPGGAILSVGDKVRVVPNHVCVVVNTQRTLYVVDGDEVVDTWTVDAQSRVR